jgi:hypothetical protein
MGTRLSQGQTTRSHEFERCTQECARHVFYSDRSIVTGSIRTAWITAGSASTTGSVAFTWQNSDAMYRIDARPSTRSASAPAHTHRHDVHGYKRCDAAGLSAGSPCGCRSARAALALFGRACGLYVSANRVKVQAHSADQ